jgi:hypothetical protein
VTRRSGDPDSVFHPEPLQMGQTSTAAFIGLLRLCTGQRHPRKPNHIVDCVHPVEQPLLL